jgi:thioester reductase-like protein
LGLSPETYQQLTNEVTDIVHSAASVKLNQTLSEARRACLAPVRHIVLLARGCSENLRKLEYLSTVGVAGRQPGIFREQPVTNHFETRNTYEQAKREAEMLLWQECMRELPVTIYRPSMVVGNSGSGAVLSFQVFYHLLELVLGRRSRGFVPELCAARVDTVPVDYLAEAIYAINSKAGAVGSIFHLCSGTRAIELKSLASTARLLFEKRGLHVPKSRSVPLPIFRAALSLCRLLPNDKVTRRVRSIEPFLQYLASPQIFDNGLSSEYLTSQGIVLPLPENYLRPVIDFYLDSITRS